MGEKSDGESKINNLIYDPFKCGLCDAACETLEAIRQHCSEHHGLTKQFKCSLCSLISDAKLEVEEHGKVEHVSSAPAVLKIFHIDPSTGPVDDMKRNPLWSREMDGMKHIRGILYEDDEEMEKKKVPKLVVKREKGQER